jgi:hypothetical protein
MHHRYNFLAAQDAAKDAKACIVLWMDGGPSQLDTWDPKPGRPNGGPIQAIETSAKEVQISHFLPRTAPMMHRGAVIRSVTSEEQDHARAAYLMHTGYKPTAMLTHPTLGSIAAYESQRVEGVPGYVSIRSSAAFGFNADPGPAFLGPDVAPFVVDKPENPSQTIRALGTELKERVDLLEDLNQEFRAERPSENSKKRESMVESMRTIKDSIFAKALDLRDEKPETIARFVGDNRPGPVGPYQASPTQFGHGCLLARRLVTAGVRFVEVNLGGWDTHGDNFNAVGTLCRQLDPALSALLDDLDKGGLLDRTLVLWMGEFGRTPQINQGKGRDHWPNGFSVAMWGGGVGGGRVIGETDPDGAKIVKGAVTIPDLFATVVHLLGIDPAKRYAGHDVGAVRVTDNGRPVKAVYE